MIRSLNDTKELMSENNDKNPSKNTRSRVEKINENLLEKAIQKSLEETNVNLSNVNEETNLNIDKNTEKFEQEELESKRTGTKRKIKQKLLILIVKMIL